MLKVAIIITIVDPSDKNPGCLEECQRQIDAIQAEERYAFSIFMNTAGEIGQESIWTQTSKEGYDFYLWIDNDLQLAENALTVFLENSEFLRHKAIIAGTVASPDKMLLFGGRTRRGKILKPDPIIPIPCYLFDNDLVLVPSDALMRLDAPEELLHRSIIDYGCGAKAARAGIPRVIAPGILAETNRKIEIPVWKNPEYPILERAGSFLKEFSRALARMMHSSFN